MKLNLHTASANLIEMVLRMVNMFRMVLYISICLLAHSVANCNHYFDLQELDDLVQHVTKMKLDMVIVTVSDSTGK